MNDRWMIESILSDSIHNYTAVLGMTTDHGNHTMFQRFYIAGQLAQNQTVPIDLAHLVSDNLSIVGPGPGQPLNSDVQKGQFIDQYSDAPINNTEMSGQNIWYGINTANIQFEQNMDSYAAMGFSTTDIAMAIVQLPIMQGAFSNTNINLQEGQQFALATDIPITHSQGSSPCATPLSNSLTSSVQQTFVSNWNSDTEILANLIA